jgi:hypothetical protein
MRQTINQKKKKNKKVREYEEEKGNEKKGTHSSCEQE